MRLRNNFTLLLTAAEKSLSQLSFTYSQLINPLLPASFF